MQIIVRHRGILNAQQVSLQFIARRPRILQILAQRTRRFWKAAVHS